MELHAPIVINSW